MCAGYRAGSMDLEQRLSERAGQLTPTERRIADVVLTRPQVVAFGTVAEVADASGAGTATVVRFAAKLGFDGFTGMQSEVRGELAHQLRPAAERIREDRATNASTVQLHADSVVANTRATLDAVREGDLRHVVDRLADDEHAVLVLSGAASRGVASQFLGDLEQLRPGCRLLDGNPIDVARLLALAGPAPVVLALDLRRYERWLIDTLGAARDAGAWIVALTDDVLSPVARAADLSFAVAAASTGPFDSHVATLALLDLFVAEVAAARRVAATERIDRIEAAWTAADALTD